MRKLINDAFDAMKDESNSEVLKDIMEEYEPIVFLRKSQKIVCGMAFDVCTLVGSACMQDKDFHLTVKVAMEAIEEYEKEKSAPTVQADA